MVCLILQLLLVGTCFICAAERPLKYEDIASDQYNYLVPPQVEGLPVDVKVTISKLHIRSVDESEMAFSTTVELMQQWTDSRLTYPDWLNETYVLLDSHWKNKLWNPNLYFRNAVDGKLDNIIMPSSFFWFTKNRVIYYVCRLMLRLECEMDLLYFPHDEQECSLQIASALFSDAQVELTLGSETDRGYSGMQQFMLVRCLDKSCRVIRPGINISCVERVLVLRRRSGYYVINVYIPTVLIVIMSMLTFWIPPDAVPARITLGVTSLLTIITKQYQASMPSVSYIVALNVWLSSCIAFVFCSLLEYATVIALSTRRAAHDLDAPLQAVDLNKPMVMLKSNGTWCMKNTWAPREKKKRIKPMHIDYCSRIFFPTTFTVFCVVYWQYYRV